MQPFICCLLTALLLAASDGCATHPQRASDPSRMEIMEELEAYCADFSARRWCAFATHFWPGATITTVWQPPGEPRARVVSSTIAQFIEKAPQGPDSKAIFEERMTGFSIT